MTPETVQALADYLASVDADWRTANGYTGRPVHRREYWRNMAARLLADSVKNIPKRKSKPNAQGHVTADNTERR